jgi:hypothetical protein
VIASTRDEAADKVRRALPDYESASTNERILLDDLPGLLTDQRTHVLVVWSSGMPGEP